MTHRVTIRRILCPTDYSESSREALRRAVELAGWFGAGVTALHVIGVVAPGLPVSDGGRPHVSDDFTYLWEGEEEARLEAFVAPWLAEGVPVETRLVAGATGDISREIRAQAEELSADLIVMGTHGRSGIAHILMGSITERLLRVAPCPVLTLGPERLPADGEPLFRRVLCATDLEGPASPTVELAASLASENLARLTLLHVIEELGPDAGTEERPLVALEPLRRTLTAEARGRLAKLAVPARSFCQVTERVETGRAWREILRVARETHADLVVVGAHSGGALGRVVLGSNADQVVRHAECPVLVVRDRSASMEDAVSEAVVSDGAVVTHREEGM